MNEWIVLFSDPDHGGWWTRFTKRGFGHVCAVAYHPGSRLWLLYDWSWFRHECTLVEGSRIDRLIGRALEQGAAVRFRPAGAGHPLRALGGYCVPAIRHLLGVGGHAVTPFQLYRQLIREGGREVRSL